MNVMFKTKDLQEQTLWSDIKGHTQRVTYSCKSFVCNERFTQASYLARHKRRHTGDKPYECDVYDNKFPSCSNLLKHEAKDDKKNKYFDLGIEPKGKEIHGYHKHVLCCDKKFDMASELENWSLECTYFCFEKKDSVT